MSANRLTSSSSASPVPPPIPELPNRDSHETEKPSASPDAAGRRPCRRGADVAHQRPGLGRRPVAGPEGQRRTPQGTPGDPGGAWLGDPAVGRLASAARRHGGLPADRREPDREGGVRAGRTGGFVPEQPELERESGGHPADPRRRTPELQPSFVRDHPRGRTRFLQGPGGEHASRRPDRLPGHPARRGADPRAGGFDPAVGPRAGRHTAPLRGGDRPEVQRPACRGRAGERPPPR